LNLLPLRLGLVGARSYTKEVGQALAAALPERAVLSLETTHNPSDLYFPKHDLMFWTGAMAYQPLTPELASRAHQPSKVVTCPPSRHEPPR
jgi:hypothetical protein